MNPYLRRFFGGSSPPVVEKTLAPNSWPCSINGCDSLALWSPVGVIFGRRKSEPEAPAVPLFEFESPLALCNDHKLEATMTPMVASMPDADRDVIATRVLEFHRVVDWEISRLRFDAFPRPETPAETVGGVPCDGAEN